MPAHSKAKFICTPSGNSGKFQSFARVSSAVSESSRFPSILVAGSFEVTNSK